MSDRTDVFRSRPDGVVIPRIWVTVAVSICIHIAALWVAPPKLTPPSALGDDPSSRVQLTLRLNPPGPMVPPAAPMLPSPKQSTPPAPAKAAPEGDLSSYIEARRRARGDAAPVTPSDDADARSKSVVAANLGSPRDRSFGYDPRQGGGMFRIERIGTDYAEFHFFGWNNQISRNTKQLIEVRKGENSDIRIAVVRKMIAIIRETAQEDFVWVSTRLGRSLTLSARAKDNGGLEEFMMREFFPDAAPVK